MRLVELLRDVRPDFRKTTLQRCLTEVNGWSDFEVVQAIQDYGLLERLGPNIDKARFTLSDADLKDGSTKVQELLRILAERRKVGGQTLVFSQFTQFLDVIEVALKRFSIRFVRLDGRTGTEDRPAMVRAFQAKGSTLDVFLLSTKAGGVGLNLTSADCVVMMDLSFNPQDNRQAEDRVHRLGQTKAVSIHYLVCEGTIEESILRGNLKKMALDYQFGGQRSLLDDANANASASVTAVSGHLVAAAGDDHDELSDDVDEDVDDGKAAEHQAMAELGRLCSGS